MNSSTKEAKQENWEFKASLDYVPKPCVKVQVTCEVETGRMEVQG
jgi:hypothetical protein